jgi:hypothetical protein
MKNETIYLAKITEMKGHGSNIVFRQAVFSTRYAAEAFMMENNMVRTGRYWRVMPDAFEYEGTIDELTFDALASAYGLEIN